MDKIQHIMIQYKEFLALLTLIGVEILPIKVNPLTWLGNICGKLLGIKALNEKIDEVSKKVDTNEIDRIRYEILQFSGSLRNGLDRTENDYTHIEELYRKYHEDLKANSYITSEMEFIRQTRNKIKKRTRKKVVDKQ